LVDKIYIKYPVNINESVMRIKKLSTDDKGEIHIDPDSNPLFFNMNGFTYGFPIDSDDKKRIFPQDIRISLTVKVLLSFLNVEYLKENDLLLDYDSLH